MDDNTGNIVLAQIIEDTGVSRRTRELIPPDSAPHTQQTLIKDDKEIKWGAPHEIGLYNDNGRIGIGRMPLYNYTFDIGVEKNTKTTALHIGDGKYGFSLGNGTDTGFLPEIIGVGKDENDAGLYFIGVSGNDEESTTPLIVFDGRDMFGKKLSKRPVVGITSGDYNEYAFLIDQESNVHVNDLIIENQSLKSIIKELREDILNLKLSIK